MSYPAMRIIEGPARSGKTSWCVNQCVLALDNGENVQVILPSRSLVEDFTRRLIAHPEFNGSMNLELDTFYSLVKTLAGRLDLPYQELDDARLSLMLDRYLEAERSDYPVLTRHDITPGYLDALLDYFSDLNNGGVQPESLQSATSNLEDSHTRRRLDELHRLYIDFSEHLLQHNFVSREQLFRLVHRNVSENADLLRRDRLLVDGFYDFNSIQCQLLDQLFRHMGQVDFTLLTGEERVFDYTRDTQEWLRQHGKAHEAEVLRLSRENTDGNPHPEELFGEETARADAANVTMIGAGDTSVEAQEVTRRIKRAILDEGLDPDRIAVIHRGNEETHSRYIHSLNQENIPVEGAVKSGLATNPAIAALLQWYDVTTGDFPREELVRWLELKYVKPAVSNSADLKEQIGGLAGRAQIIRGRESWIERLSSYLERERDRLERGELSEEELNWRRPRFRKDRKAAEGFREFADALPEQRIASWSAHLQDLERVMELIRLEQSADDMESAGKGDSVPAGRDKRAIAAFRELSEQIRDLDEEISLPELTTGEFARHLRDLVRLRTYEPEGVSGRGVSVISVEQARGRTWERVFLPELVDENFPVRYRHHPLVAYRDRAAMNRVLPEGMTIPEHGADMREERLLFYVAFTRAEGFPVLSTVTGSEEISVSPFYEEVGRFDSINAGSDSENSTSPNHTVQPSDILLSREASWLKVDLLQHLMHLPPVEETGFPVNTRHLNLLRSVVSSRESDQFTVYDGQIEDPSLLSSISDRIFSRNRPMSPAQMEAFYTSPFQYFSRYHLGLREIEEVTDELPASDRGQLLHRIMERYYRSLKETGRIRELARAPEESADLLEQVLHDSFEEFESQGAPLPPLLWESEQRRIRDYVNNAVSFFAEQLPWGDPDVIPEYFELDFGMVEGGLPQFEVTIPSGTIAFRGKVDRLDRDPDSGRFIVVDYKTSRGKKNAEFHTGEALQLPIYAMAARELLPGYAYPSRLTYYVFKGNEEKGKIEFDEDWEAYFTQVESLLEDAVSEILNGHFYPEAGLCDEYCPVRFICRCDENRIRMKERGSAQEQEGQ